ncbi:MAG: glycoside hydrolase family 16 protein [Streptosporangiales bacterium]
MLVVACLLASCSAAAGSDRGGVFSSPKPGQQSALDESFDGDVLDDSVWSTCYWWADDNGCTIASNHELEWYVPEQVNVRDGALRLTAAHRDVTGSDGKQYPYVSGMVTTGPPADGEKPKLAFRYGTVAVRFQTPRGRGLWPAIWMLPANQQSRPEIDLLEASARYPGQVMMHVHPNDGPSEGKNIRLPERSTLSSGWHTVRLDWQPDRLVFFLDGAKVWQVSGTQVPQERMYLVMNLAVGGTYGGQPDSSAFPATLRIDHVRIRVAP